MGIIEERIKIREKYIERTRLFTECVLKNLPDSTVIIYGSVARGDFNVWSDIDVLIITRNTIPNNPIHRLDIVHECLKQEPLVEPIIITETEFFKLLSRNNPLVMEAFSNGIVLIDRLNLLKNK